jgi:hypothetical protein
MFKEALRSTALFGSLWMTGGWAAEEIHRAFVNLYEAADGLVKNPEKEYDPKGIPEFPYPDSIQKQWRASEQAASNQISPDDRQNLYPCAAELHGAIDKAERGYLLTLKQKDNPDAVQSGKDLLERARQQVEACAGAAEYARAGVPAPAPHKRQDANAGESRNRDPIDGSASEYGKTMPALYGAVSYRDVTLSVDLKAGHLGGEYIRGRVRIDSGPNIYDEAAGTLYSSSEFRIERLFFQGKEVAIPESLKPIKVPLTRK